MLCGCLVFCRSGAITEQHLPRKNQNERAPEKTFRPSLSQFGDGPPGILSSVIPEQLQQDEPPKPKQSLQEQLRQNSEGDDAGENYAGC